VALETKDI